MTSKAVEAKTALGDPGVCHAHLTLAWDEAAKGCTRVVEVEGRLEWLDIPRNTEDGQEICFPGRGKAVPDDNRHGDLWVSVEVLARPEPGEDVTLTLEVSPIEALTGGRKTVEVGGRTVWVRVPANVEPGQVLTIQGEGGEGENGGPRGNLSVVIEVANSLPIPFGEVESTALAVPEQSLPVYEPAPVSAPTRGKFPWPVAALLGVVLAAGAAALLIPRGGAAPEAPAVVQPIQAQPPLPNRPPLEPRLPIKQAQPVKPTTPADTVRPAQPAQPRPTPRPRTAPRAQPRRVVRTAAPRRAAAAPPRKPRATPAAKPAARRRFCGICGRPSSGRFCGGCGRKN